MVLPNTPRGISFSQNFSNSNKSLGLLESDLAKKKKRVIV
jgi:hypothetical protein